jgi:hypothetical protein
VRDFIPAMEGDRIETFSGKGFTIYLASLFADEGL